MGKILQITEARQFLVKLKSRLAENMHSSAMLSSSSKEARALLEERRKDIEASIDKIHAQLKQLDNEVKGKR